MYEPPPSPLDAADAAFRELLTGSDPLTLDGASLGCSLPPRLILLDELRSLLLRSSTPYEARDLAFTELVRRARNGEERAVIGLVGIMLPGLRNVANRLARNYSGDPDCIDAGVLAGFVEAVLGSPLPAGGLAVHLLWAAYRGGREIWLQEMSASSNRASGELVPAPTAVTDHIDFVLARAVRAKRITADEAELIAATRVERIRLAKIARESGVSHEALKRRRQRAEARLVAYLRSQDPDLSRFARDRGLRECGTPRGRQGKVGRPVRPPTAQHHVSTQEGGEQAPNRPASASPGCPHQKVPMRRPSRCDR